MKSANLDGIDLKILRAISEDSRASIESVSEKVNLSPTPVRRRVKRLEDDGIIKNYTISVDMKKCEYNLHLFVMVRLHTRDSETISKFEHRIRERPEITSCQLVTGACDYILQVFIKDMEDYNEFLRSFLAELPGVFGLETCVTISSVKETVPLPTQDSR